MSLQKEEKVQIISEFRKHENDVGSAEVQIGILNGKIKKLSEHVERAPKDNHSRKGLVSMVAKRRKLLNYVKRVRPQEYGKLIETLGLRK
ncbi:MAG: 30S ribosomal protein S15 [Candidatus Dadabacteria bacterium]|nr:30S ribosomal protein S15 [Candidatus Dadabacteria bacterium]